jgi:4-hydroxybenzoate polyprenyltransferase
MDLRAWLNLARLSNLPTVWSNVAAGMTWGLLASDRMRPEETRAWAPVRMPLDTLLNEGFVLMLAISALYVGGMVLNDAADARIDARERPDRPIPSGRVSRRSAGLVGGLLLILGWLLCLPYARSPVTLPLATALVVLIVLYNGLHRRVAAAVVLVALCRAAVALLAAGIVFAAVSRSVPVTESPAALLWLALHAAILFVFVLIVSLLAGDEVAAGRARWVGRLVAGIALLDALLMAATGQWAVAGFCLACFAAALAGQRWIAGS